MLRKNILLQSNEQLKLKEYLKNVFDARKSKHECTVELFFHCTIIVMHENTLHLAHSPFEVIHH